jgi:hypothetical protein
MDFSRRRFLVAAGGTVLPLPYLASLHACGGASVGEGVVASHPGGHPLIVVRPGSGVVQEDAGEPERFWPVALGPIDRRALAEESADRVIAELADHADRLLLVRGTTMPFAPSHEAHAGAGNQLLTAARPGPPTATVMTYAQGESIDNWIARRGAANGGEPLALYAGRRDNYGEEVLSYRGPGQLRAAEDDPLAAYERLIGKDHAVNASVNDLVLDQLRELERSPRLSTEDRRRLQLHTESVREFEVLAERLDADIVARMRDVTGETNKDVHALEVARLQCHLAVLVLDTGFARAATLQIGDRLDNAHYEVRGRRLPSFHTISHRNVEPDDLGDFASAQDMHFEINRLHMQVFKHLLDLMEARDMLDRSVAVFVSDVSTGSHRLDEMPWVIAGRGDGTLRNGAYVDAGGVTHNRLLATLLTATGHRDADGGPITHFGDESVAGGTIPEMLAG